MIAAPTSSDRSETDDARVVLVIGTGGTIAQAGSREATVPVDTLVRTATGIGAPVSIRTEQAFQVPSPDITPDHWTRLTAHVRAALEDPAVAGVVVTHGTDTLEETAFFLDLVVTASKPVVIVGAMRPSDSPEADGPSNLADAIALAGVDAARNRGVLVTLNGAIHGARHVTKTHPSSLSAFVSPELGVLGTVRDGVVTFDRPYPRSTPLGEFASYDGAPLPFVEIVYGYVGISPQSLALAGGSGAKGVVVAGTGDGSVPKALLPAVQGLQASGIVVVRASRTNAGVVRRNGELDDDDVGTVAALALNPQKARILLMLCLWAGLDVEAVQRAFAVASRPA